MKKPRQVHDLVRGSIKRVVIGHTWDNIANEAWDCVSDLRPAQADNIVTLTWLATKNRLGND
jgi:hypothetical protein